MNKGFIHALVVLVSFGTGCEACKDFFDAGDDEGGGGVRDGGVGDMCTRPSHCRAGLVCTDDGVCGPSGTGVEGSVCQLTGDCMEGLYCGPTRTCTPAGGGGEGADCASTGECERGLICVIEGLGGRCRGAGAGDLGDACTTTSDCLAGLACTPTGAGTTECQNPNAVPDVDGGAVAPPTLPFWPGETCVEETGEARAYFEVPRGTDADGDFYRLPYPNDIRRTGGGLDLSGHPSPGTVLPIDIIDRYLRASEEDLDGFSVNPVVYFRFSHPYDWDSVGGQMRIVDITPGSPTYGNEHSLAWLTTAGPISKYICENWLAVRTPHGGPLRPRTTYAIVLGTGITPNPDVGGTFARSSDFDAMLASSPPSDAALTDAWDAYAPLRAWIGDAGEDAGAILNAAVFTTQDPEALVPRLREVIRAGDPAEVTGLVACEDGVASPCDDGTAERACVTGSADHWELHGRIALPIFQEGTAPYETPDDGGGIALDGDGLPVVQRTEPVCFSLTVPKSAPPAEGFPLLVYLHGTGGSFTGPVRSGLAGDVASMAGAATLAIDLPQHGARRGESTRDPSVLFFNFANPRAARDNIHQGAADLLSLVHWSSVYALDAAGSPTGQALSFDGSRVVVFAHSQGATHASLALPYEPGVGAALLSGNGGDLTQSLLNKTEPVDIAGLLPFALLDPTGDGHLSTGDFHPALAIFQAYFDTVDPVSYAWRVHRTPVADAPAQHVFMTYGLEDSYSPEPTMQAYSLAAGLVAVEPVLRDYGLATTPAPLSGNVTRDTSAWTIGLRQYMPEGGEDGHFVSSSASAQGAADATRFVVQALNGELPEIGE